MVAHGEGARLAERLIEETCTKQNISPGQLTIHADRGPAMTSKTVALLFSDLDILRSHSRPYVSDDNPFSESHFRTLKYRPDFPDRFGSLEHARQVCRPLFAWYNAEHHHSGLAFLTPATVHHGRADQVLDARHRVRLAAYAAHPERFVNGPPRRAEPAERGLDQPAGENDAPGCPRINATQTRTTLRSSPFAALTSRAVDRRRASSTRSASWSPLTKCRTRLSHGD